MKHKPVLLQKIIKLLDIKPGNLIVDATLGAGGHSLAMSSELKLNGTLVCIDLSEEALKNLETILLAEGFLKNKENISNNGLNVYLVKENFKEISSVLARKNLKQPDIVLADLGLSVDELEQSNKGFSFHKDEFLDMRLDESLTITAADLLNGLYKKEMEKLFKEIGECNFYKKLVKEIIFSRAVKPITRTTELKSIINKVIPVFKRSGSNKNPDAKVFQALRIAVNSEYANLREFLKNAFSTLAENGRLAVISFHSGEDRIVKDFFMEKVKITEALWVAGLVRSNEKEVQENPNSRSAKLRIIKKLKKKIST